jgi:hypothetical protein
LNTSANTPAGPGTSPASYVEFGADLDRRLKIEEHQAKMRLLAAQTAAAERGNQQDNIDKQNPASRSATDLNDLFGNSVPGLQRALLNFLQKIQHYAMMYEWQRQVLPLAIQHHTTVIIEGATNVENWKIPPELRDQFCLTRLEPIASTERSQSRKRSRSDANNISTKDQICNKFNNDKGCDWAECRRRHECNVCGAKEHGASVCKTKRRQ